ncbi:MAG: glycosyl hydrolase, partial [Paludibacter sp.]
MNKSIFTALFLLIYNSMFCENALKSVTVYSTSENTNQRLTVTDIVHFSNVQSDADAAIFVNPSKTFQTILGLGGAITDASAEVFAKLPNNKQIELLEAYFDSTKGIGYSLVRTHINSCDFSTESYSYIADGDKDLKTFNVQHDKAFRIPLIKLAMKTANNNLTIYASPWSPPAFMKDNKNMLHGGKLLPEYYQSWANYYVKFINAYQQEGIPIWGLTIQNEPMAAQPWESCTYSPEEERDFLKYFLGPTLEKNGLAQKKIIVFDHNRDFLNQRANVIFDDSTAAKFAWGIGFHWYETWDGG